MTFDSINNYEAAHDFLAARIDYERAAAEKMTARSFNLDRMRELLARIGNPHETIPAVHITGTKGKGSTAAMAAEMLIAAGYRTGLFTSPHISTFEERMRVDGEMPDRETFVELINEIAAAVLPMDLLGPTMQPTYFEIATALAWLYFRRERCDFAVLEVGMGGRLDSTNVCRPDVTLITNVSRDHMHVLGNTKREIAREKAGIIKPHVPVISGVAHPEAREVIREVADRNEADLFELNREIQFEYRRSVSQAFQPDASGERLSETQQAFGQAGKPDLRPVVDVRTPNGEFRSLPLNLAGAHQAANAALAVAAIDVLRNRGYRVPDAAVCRGMENVQLPLRFEVIGESPPFVVDAAHNVASAVALANTIQAEFGDRPKTLIFATSRDKEVERIAEILFPHFERVILTRFLGNPRAVSPEELEERTGLYCHGTVLTAQDPESAVALARHRAAGDEVICATGSFYLAAEVRGVLLSSRGQARRELQTAVAEH